MAEILGKRLAWLIEKRGTTQSAVGAAAGLSQPSIGRLISGQTRESGKLVEIARFLATTPEYLTGESDDPGTDAVAAPRPAFRGAEVEEEDDDTVFLDEIDVRLGMGGAYLDSPVSADRRSFSRGWLRQITKTPPELLYWAIGDGDSMEPTIRSGELLLIDRSERTPRMGDGIWACAYGEVGMIKRLRPLPNGGGVEILSDNQLVPKTTAHDGELHVLGRVVAVVRRL